jgi:hypothetical protein
MARGWTPIQPDGSADSIMDALDLIEATLSNIATWAGEIHDDRFREKATAGLTNGGGTDFQDAAETARTLDALLAKLIENVGAGAADAGELRDRIEGDYIAPILERRKAFGTGLAVR